MVMAMATGMEMEPVRVTWDLSVVLLSFSLGFSGFGFLARSRNKGSEGD